MKRSHLFAISLTAAAIGFVVLLLSGRATSPISVAALGRPYPDMPAEEFQITNQSSREFFVTCSTMYKTNGVWSFVPRGCVITSYLLRPHSSHKEMALVPLPAKSWRLVVEYYRAT
jgi:hypothetical protein